MTTVKRGEVVELAKIGFAALVAKLEAQGKSPEQAKAIAAAIGRKKYGNAKFAKMGAKGAAKAKSMTATHDAWGNMIDLTVPMTGEATVTSNAFHVQSKQTIKTMPTPKLEAYVVETASALGKSHPYTKLVARQMQKRSVAKGA
jgi:hypothetical protein